MRIVTQVVGCSFLMGLTFLSAHAQPAEPEPADKPPVRAVFEDAGFTFHGETRGFYATDRPSRTADGIIVAGELPEIGQPRWEGERAVWHVEQQDVVVVAPPNIGPGAGKPWGMFSDSNRKGWVIGTTNSHQDGKGDHLDHAYIRKPDDTLIHILAPKCEQIAPCDLNDAGQVVGWYSPTRQWRGFVWSQQEGLVDLGEDGADQVQATDINSHGMIVGNVQYGKAYYPRVWLPPKAPGGERVVKTLDIPEGHTRATAGDVNDDGVVLVQAGRPLYDAARPGLRYNIATPYLWTVEGGYQDVHRPEMAYAGARAIANDGSVLLECWETFEPPNPRDPHLAEYILSKGDSFTRLPKYPDANYTTYHAMSDDGLILGSASFTAGGRHEEHAVITFVISKAEVK